MDRTTDFSRILGQFNHRPFVPIEALETRALLSTTTTPSIGSSVGDPAVFLPNIELHHYTLTSTSTSLTVSPVIALSGQSVTLTSTVTGSGGTPTGSVAFLEGTTTLGTGTLNGSGVATYATTALVSQGIHNLTGSYSGDTTFASSTSSTATETIKYSSTTTFTFSSNPAFINDTVTFTSTVTSASGGTPTGKVSFFDGGTSLGTAFLDGSGIASFSTSSLTVGGHSIAALYAGSATIISNSSGYSSLTINKYTTSTSLNSNVSTTVSVGTSITYSASVTSAYGVPTGTVTFWDNMSLNLGTVTLSGGAASLTTTLVVGGTSTINAIYSADASFAASTSPGVTQSLTKYSTTTTLDFSSSPSIYGTPLTMTASVTSPGGVPTGHVSFFDGGASLGSGNLDGSGVAIFTTSSLSVGSHGIKAIYGGSSYFTNTNSGFIPLYVVNPTTTTLSVSPTGSPLVFGVGSSVTFNASVTSTAGGTISGTVTFFDGTTSVGVGTLSGGLATLGSSSLTTGTHGIAAVYGGGSGFGQSTSSSITPVVVDQPTVMISPVGSSFDEGQIVALTCVATGYITPPVPPNTLHYVWTVSFNGGATTSAGYTQAISYHMPDNGSYAFTVSVTDDSLNPIPAVDHITITAANVDEVIIPSILNPNDEGSSVTLGVLAYDPGTDTVIKWVVDWGDGSTTTHGPGTTPLTTDLFTHTYADGGNPNTTYPITLTATDEDGSYSNNPTSAIIQNVAPYATFQATSGSPQVSGSPVDFEFTSSGDVSSTDTAAGFTYSINYNDGTGDHSGSTGSHTFYSPGNYTIVGKIYDKDGGVTQYNRTISISPLALSLSTDPSPLYSGVNDYIIALPSGFDPADTTALATVTLSDGSIDLDTPLGSLSGVYSGGVLTGFRAYMPSGFWWLNHTAGNLNVFFSNSAGSLAIGLGSVSFTNPGALPAPTLTSVSNSYSGGNSTVSLNLTPVNSTYGVDSYRIYIVSPAGKTYYIPTIPSGSATSTSFTASGDLTGYGIFLISFKSSSGGSYNYSDRSNLLTI